MNATNINTFIEASDRKKNKKKINFTAIEISKTYEEHKKYKSVQ